jgi:hypothetical protein
MDSDFRGGGEVMYRMQAGMANVFFFRMQAGMANVFFFTGPFTLKILYV